MAPPPADPALRAFLDLLAEIVADQLAEELGQARPVNRGRETQSPGHAEKRVCGNRALACGREV